MGFQSRRRGEQTIKDLEKLRNNLAHSQDIVTCDWDTIVRLESGMVTTVEPGIYIPGTRKVPARWRNIGIRIEDDVAITHNGPDVLSKGLAKEPDEVETLMQG